MSHYLIQIGYFVYVREMNTLSGESAISKLFYLPSENGFIKRKDFFVLGSKFFLFRVYPLLRRGKENKLFPIGGNSFSEAASCAGKQTGSHNSCLPCKM